MIPRDIQKAIDQFKYQIPTYQELTELFDLINKSCSKLAGKKEVCDYLQRVLDEAPANIKAEKKRQIRQNEERIQQKRAAAERKEKISDIILQTGFWIGIALMIVLSFLGMNFWLISFICCVIMVGSFLGAIYYRDGKL